MAPLISRAPAAHSGSEHGQAASTGLIIGIVVAGVLILIMILMLMYPFIKKKKETEKMPKPGSVEQFMRQSTLQTQRVAERNRSFYGHRSANPPRLVERESWNPSHYSNDNDPRMSQPIESARPSSPQVMPSHAPVGVSTSVSRQHSMSVSSSGSSGSSVYSQKSASVRQRQVYESKPVPLPPVPEHYGRRAPHTAAPGAIRNTQDVSNVLKSRAHGSAKALERPNTARESGYSRRLSDSSGSHYSSEGSSSEPDVVDMTNIPLSPPQQRPRRKSKNPPPPVIVLSAFSSETDDDDNGNKGGSTPHSYSYGRFNQPLSANHSRSPPKTAFAKLFSHNR